MPQSQELATRPWLRGLIACTVHREAIAVRAVLQELGLRWSSVPAGRASEAWTCVAEEGTLGVVVSGPGAERARQAASFWMPRSRTVVVLGAGPATGAVPPPAVVLDGDPRILERARRGAPGGIEVADGRVEQVEARVRSAQAWESLAASGIAAVSAQPRPWLQAASAVGGVALLCQGIHERLEAPDRRISGLLHPSERAARRRLDKAVTEVIDAAARCAVAALLGPRPA